MSDRSSADKTQEAASKPKGKLRRKLAFWVGFSIMVLSLCSGLATYFILTGLTPLAPNASVNLTVLIVNLLLVIAMLAVIGWHIAQLWAARRKQAAAANLHILIVSLFCAIAAFPIILLGIFANTSLDRGLDHVFSVQMQSVVRNSVLVSEAYLEDQGDNIRGGIIGMARDIDRAAILQKTDQKRFQHYISAQADIRQFPMALLIDENGQPLKVAANRLKIRYDPPPKRAMELANKGQSVIMTPNRSFHVSGLIKLKQFTNTYLFVKRPVRENVVKHLRETRARARQYKKLKSQRVNVQITYGLMLSVVAMSLLLTAVWIGLWFAGRIVKPIRRLITAAENVSGGDLNVRVKVKKKEGDLAKLSSTFNNMTFRLRTQRDELINANTVIDDRRRFTEAVLSGVTAGVIGVNSDGIITLTNPSAIEMLGVAERDLIKSSLLDVVPAFKELWERAQAEQVKNLVEAHIDILIDGVERHFAVRFTREIAGDDEYGYVITFDDVTELVSAQRNTAWADIARRIAHEIKNPLTPIQLSAERIRRKYGETLGQDRTVFDQCTDTIIRQVGDIGRMVDEFSSFARMPEPAKKEHDVRRVLRDAFILFQSGQENLDIKLDCPDEPVLSLCDERLLSQAVTNLVKNASEAIDSVRAVKEENGELYQGSILIRMKALDNKCQIEIIDNGCGLPETNRNKLVEPYMTTREKGTGLGLAIVQKITEQHGGTLQLSDAPAKDGFTQGACVRIILPIVSAENETPKNNKVEALSAGDDSAKEEQPEENEEHANILYNRG
ncbi:MAG: ATP-binding protein [Methyloligellaceae bacterium]